MTLAQVVFLHGARTGDDLYYSEEIEAEWPGKGIETRRVLTSRRQNGPAIPAMSKMYWKVSLKD